MHKIAVVDDDEYWCLAVQRFFRRDFEVSVFKGVDRFLSKAGQYELAIIDFSIPPARYETSMTGSELIRHLKETLPDPPLLVLASGFISKNDREIGYQICPEADDFIAKDAGLDEILQRVKTLLESKKPQPVDSE